VAETVLHLGPHPDDEAIGAPATLMALRDAGWRVVNLAGGLGSDPAVRERRRGEVEEACRRARFALRLAAGADPEAEIAAALAAERPTVVVSPDPTDPHPAHRALAVAAARALSGEGHAAAVDAWWTWSVWGELPAPSLLVPFGEERMREVLHVLDAHRSQIERNDYPTLVRARAEVSRVRGPELLHGFGAAAVPEPYAELLAERRRGPDGWRVEPPRTLRP
jgi:LmbE family N-acetylglucosaminyl deacetylase